MFQLKIIGGIYEWAFEKFSKEVFVSREKAAEALFDLMVEKGCKRKNLGFIGQINEFEDADGVVVKVINRHKADEDSFEIPMTGFVIKLEVVE